MRTILVYPVPLERYEVWQQFKPYVQLFCDEMRRFKAGCDYELIAVLNTGYPGRDSSIVEHAAIKFEGLPVQFIEYHGSGCDIGSWQYAASIFRNCFMVAVTTRTRPYFDGWLAKMVEAHHGWGERLYSTCVSKESGKYHACLRTIAISTNLFAEFPRPLNTRDVGVAFEVGNATRLSFSEWQQDSPLIVYREGVCTFADAIWRPDIYRKGTQENLLTWDRHTDAYRDAGPEEKARLERMCFEGKE